MVLLDGDSLALGELLAIADNYTPVGLSPRAGTRVDAARAVVDDQAAGDEAVYGINTGFGALAETRIPREALGALQLNLLRSHAAGVGDMLPVRAVRASMVLIGEGEVTFVDDRTVLPRRDALRRAGLEPATLMPKERLALINGTQPS